MSKKCTGCKTDVSEEWTLSKELAKSNRRMFIIIIVVVSLWVSSLAGTIGGFLWYLDSFDYESTETVTTEEIVVDGGENGTANYIGNDGTINNG